MLRGDETTRDWLADALRGAVDDVVAQHSMRLTQEAQISSKIADRIEQKLTGMQINGYEVSVVANDMPDRGPNSLESKTGVDLYIGIRVRRTDIVMETAKGLLVQGKLSGAHSTKEQDRLVEQCRKMASTSSKGAYVWIYGSQGATVIPASELVSNPNLHPSDFSARNIGQHFRDVLDCVAGDEQLVTSGVFEHVDELNAMMRELGARAAVAVDLKPRP